MTNEASKLQETLLKHVFEYMLQVIRTNTGTPNPAEVREALHRAGFSKQAERCESAGDWIIKELK